MRVDAHIVLPPQQFAYRRSHSTEDALSLAIDQWSRAIDQGQMVAVCFADMSKAFDRVNHQQLLDELHTCNIGYTVLQWLHNYLNDRMQAVKIGSRIASAVPVSRGVPQGSVLGPVLYSIYVRRIPSILSNVTVIQYADDICFFARGTDTTILSQTLSSSLHDLNSFKCANGLAPAPLADRFLLNKRQSNLTRQNTFCTFKLPQVSSQIGLNSLSFLAADRFNGLPADLRSAPNLLHFTSQLKVFIGYPRREGS